MTISDQPTAPVIGVVGRRAWREPLCDERPHPDIPVSGFPAPEGRVRVAFYVEDGHARSVVAAQSYVVCVPFDAELDRYGGTILVCTRTDASTLPPTTETSLARIAGFDPKLVIEPYRDTAKEGSDLRHPDIPFVPTHRVVGIYRALP